MKKVIAAILTLIMLCMIFVKKQRGYEYRESFAGIERSERSDIVPPVVFATSLHDSIPASLLAETGLPDAEGIKLTFHNGNFASHFRYNAPAERVLRTLSLIPVPLTDAPADATYRKIQRPELNSFVASLSGFEKQEFPEFIQAASSNVDAYECIKPPFRHVVLISHTDNSVLHRVEYAG